jgi:hypothetical protein
LRAPEFPTATPSSSKIRPQQEGRVDGAVWTECQAEYLAGVASKGMQLGPGGKIPDPDVLVPTSGGQQTRLIELDC